MFNTAIWLACTNKTTRSIIVYFEWSPPVPLKNDARSIDLESCLLRLAKLTHLNSSQVKFDPYLNIYLLYFCILCIIVHLLLFLTWLAYFLSHDYPKWNLFSVSLWRRANARNVRLYYYPYWQYTCTDLFIFLNIYINFVFLPYEVPFLDR